MKKTQKKKQQQIKISALKKECQFLLQQKRSAEAKHQGALKEINEAVDAILKQVILNTGGNTIVLDKIDINELNKYELITKKTEVGYTITLKEK